MILSDLNKRIANKEAQVAVIGLGYVGLPVACLLAQAGFSTLGVDVDVARIEKVNAGINPIEGIEPGIAELIHEVTQSDNLHCTADYAELASVDAVLISVQTPIEEDTHLPRYEHLRTALTQLGKVLKHGALVIIESTLAPGTMNKVVIPTLEDAVGGRVGEQFFVGHCPERITPGRLLLNLRTMNRTVGGYNQAVADVMVTLYAQFVQADLDTADLLTAEIVKTAENAYRDVQIAFANELAQICEALGGDVWRVRELVNKSPGREVLFPGAGVGGHCIPKDSWLLIANARDVVMPRVISSARATNRAMPAHVVQMTLSALQDAGVAPEEAVIAVLGYAYMPDSDDTRDTPTQAYIEQIQPHVKDIRIHDPFVADYRGDVLDVVRGADATVILVKHTAYTQLDWRAMGEAMGQPVFVDARQVLPADFTAPQAIIRLIGQGTSHQQEGIRYDD